MTIYLCNNISCFIIRKLKLIHFTFGGSKPTSKIKNPRVIRITNDNNSNNNNNNNRETENSIRDDLNNYERKVYVIRIINKKQSFLHLYIGTYAPKIIFKKIYTYLLLAKIKKQTVVFFYIFQVIFVV